MKHLAPKTAVKVFALTVFFLLIASTGRTYAFDLLDLNAKRFIVSNMDGWFANAIVGIINKTAVTALVGCPLDEITGAGADTKIKDCVRGSSLVKGGPDYGPLVSQNAVPASLLGMVYTLGLESPKSVDAYPVNLAVYVNSLKHDSIIVPKEAYATTLQEVFFGTTIIGLWTQLRNVAYVFFVIMLVVFGFLVMFRYKINPQTVITVQAALPRIVINLLLITFSFPIGALALQLAGSFTVMAMAFVGSNITSMSTGDIVANTIAQAVSMMAFMATGVGAVFAAIFILVILVALLLVGIAWIVSIFTRTLRIMLMTAFAPLQFAMATIPGNEHLVTDWFKALIANMLAIPAITLMGLLGIEFIFMGGSVGASGTTEPLAKLLLGFIGLFINGLIGFWLLWNSKNAPKYIEGALGVGGGWVPGQPPKPAGRK
jgi:hypothetical protein